MQNLLKYIPVTSIDQFLAGIDDLEETRKSALFMISAKVLLLKK